MHCKWIAIVIVLVASQLCDCEAHIGFDNTGGGDVEHSPHPQASIIAPVPSQHGAPDEQRVSYHSLATPIFVLSAALSTGCSCRTRVRNFQSQGVQPDDSAWTNLLATNVITGSAPNGEYVLDMDCSDELATMQRCRAEPEHVRLVNNASTDSSSVVVAVEANVVEVAIRVSATPATALHNSRNDSSDEDLHSGDAVLDACDTKAKWAARAVIVLLTAGLTLAADSGLEP